jgi:hypothetical protein
VFLSLLERWTAFVESEQDEYMHRKQVRSHERRWRDLNVTTNFGGQAAYRFWRGAQTSWYCPKAL